MGYNVFEVANELLRLSANSHNEGELMSNMKLQKLLYYQQGFHLAYFGTPLFEEEIEAWMYGPVVPKIYDHYKCNGRNGILPDDKITLFFESSQEKALFEEVFKVYGKYSAYGLMEMTHNEAPWKGTKTGEGQVISKKSMQAFFKSRLKA